MRIILPALAGALLLAGAGPASAIWNAMPQPSGPLMVGTWVSDPGGDAEPSFAAGSVAHQTMATLTEVVITATGDAYDVTPRAFLGEQRDAPRAIAAAERQPGGG
ncbi:hypothetical protein [Elioraea sp.]|uniref:hypothetical protein n=1 Tax=Elioraea sp. TaxID=2185103 RepID=UPI0025BA941E|nr:hypothetical protein [Elioraea sp.]